MCKLVAAFNPPPPVISEWDPVRATNKQTDPTCTHGAAYRPPPQDNEFIQRHYRRTLPVRDSIKSLFGLHNETGNIYTHLIGTWQGRAASSSLP
eukprot:220345-Chlamydomonas_euryale.AAC.5